MPSEPRAESKVAPRRGWLLVLPVLYVAGAAVWATPALVIGDDIALTVDSSNDLQEVFGGAKAQYNAREITDTRPDILRLDWQLILAGWCVAPDHRQAG